MTSVGHLHRREERRSAAIRAATRGGRSHHAAEHLTLDGVRAIRRRRRFVRCHASVGEQRDEARSPPAASATPDGRSRTGGRRPASRTRTAAANRRRDGEPSQLQRQAHDARVPATPRGHVRRPPLPAQALDLAEDALRVRRARTRREVPSVTRSASATQPARPGRCMVSRRRARRRGDSAACAARPGSHSARALVLKTAVSSFCERNHLLVEPGGMTRDPRPCSTSGPRSGVDRVPSGRNLGRRFMRHGVS